MICSKVIGIVEIHMNILWVPFFKQGVNSFMTQTTTYE